MYRDDVASETLSIVLDLSKTGGRGSLQTVLSVMAAAIKHHDKAVHQGEQSVKHFNESQDQKGLIEDINGEDMKAIRAELKQYHVDFACKKEADGKYTLLFKSKDMSMIEKAIKNVVSDLSEKMRMEDQLNNARQQAEQERREDPSHGRDVNRDKDLGVDNR